MKISPTKPSFVCNVVIFGKNFANNMVKVATSSICRTNGGNFSIESQRRAVTFNKHMHTYDTENIKHVLLIVGRILYLCDYTCIYRYMYMYMYM